MGDGSAQFLEGPERQLASSAPSTRAEVVGSAGYSRGEDKFMGPPEWKQNPQSARGGLVAGYLRDGDWNIAMKWLGDNSSATTPTRRRTTRRAELGRRLRLHRRGAEVRRGLLRPT